MKVKAKFAANKFGFYGGVRRYDKDEFVLESEAHFSDRWMVKLDEEDKPRRRGRPAKEDAAETGEGAE